jgi:nicotinate-nucleotide adenylyltransferase
MTVAILGGTFDPPHIGHLVAGEAALQLPGCERVLFVPAGDPYRKAPAPGDAGPTAAQHRVEMTRLAIADNPGFAVDVHEVTRTGATYTVDTLEVLAAQGVEHPYLVLGADALADMPHWREPARIAVMARIVVAPRPGYELADCPYVVLDMPALAVSSTDIRRRVAEGRSVRYLVTPPVEAYIREHRLYAGGAQRPRPPA